MSSYKKGERYYSASHGLIEVVDGRKRRAADGDHYIIVRNKLGDHVKLWAAHNPVRLTDDQWASLQRLEDADYRLREFIINEYRRGRSPANVAAYLKTVAYDTEGD